jgi:hypothetical protein
MISIGQKIAGARISVKPAERNNLEGHPWISIGDRSHSAGHHMTGIPSVLGRWQSLGYIS